MVAIKAETYEYFIWSDTNNFSVSVYDGQTLINTFVLGAVGTVNFFSQNAAAYGSSIVFSSATITPTTYIYDEEGTITTLANSSLLAGSDAIREEGLFLVDNNASA